MRKLTLVLAAVTIAGCSSSPPPAKPANDRPPPAAYAPPVAAPQPAPPREESATIDVPRATGERPAPRDDAESRRARVDAILKAKGVKESARSPSDRIASSGGGDSQPASPAPAVDPRSEYARKLAVSVGVWKGWAYDIDTAGYTTKIRGSVRNNGDRTVSGVKVTVYFQENGRDVYEETVTVPGVLKPGYVGQVDQVVDGAPRTWWPSGRNRVSRPRAQQETWLEGHGTYRVVLTAFDLE